MAFTRFHDDPARINKQNQINSFTSRYLFDTPGQGLDIPFQEDPQMRLQYWGANLNTNTTNLESDLMGLTRQLNRDNIELNNHKTAQVSTDKIGFNNAQPFVEESRASHPAWMYKDLEQTRWETPFLNPLANLEKGFHENIQTRILEKDYFKPRIPMVTRAETTGDNYQYYLTGKSVCIGGNTY
jgi:hypothetical protein